MAEVGRGMFDGQGVEGGAMFRGRSECKGVVFRLVRALDDAPP